MRHNTQVFSFYFLTTGTDLSNTQVQVYIKKEDRNTLEKNKIEAEFRTILTKQQSGKLWQRCWNCTVKELIF